MKIAGFRNSVKIVVSSILIFALLPFHAFAYDSYSTWKSRFDTTIANMDDAAHFYGYTDSPRSEYLAWNGSYTLNGLMRMYTLTKDDAYIEKTSTYINNMYNNLGDVNGDGYLGWGSTNYTPNYTEYIVHYGMIITEWARFILLVRADSALSSSLNPQGITYGSQATTLENTIHAELIPRWNKNWSLAINNYLDEYNDNKSLPNNMYLAMSTALYMMFKVDPTKRQYLLWADQMSAKFKSLVKLSGSSYVWNYHDILVPADTHGTRYEDWSHATVDINNALHNYNRGGTWNTTDMTRFGNTIYTTMYAGTASNPRLYHSVNGSGAVSGEITGSMYDLARWNNGIWTRGEKRKSVTWTGMGAREAMDVSRILQLHPSNAAPQAFSLSSPANAATGQNTTQVFTWTPSQNASDYRLQVSTNSSFSSLVVDRPYLIDTNALVQFLDNNQTYYWRVIARNASGATVTSATQSFTTKAAPTFTLSFQHFDSRPTTAPAGHWYKQALIDGNVVWEQDLTTDAANTWLPASIDITAEVGSKSNVQLMFRVINKKAVSNYAFDFYVDSVSITNADSVNGGFEKSELWRYTEDGSAFTGGFSSAESYAGSKSFKLALGSGIAASPGKYAAVETRWGLLQ